MDKKCLGGFDDQMEIFSRSHSLKGQSVSIKIRVELGCFERPDAPEAWGLIDKYLSNQKTTDAVFELEEHESGPEILAYIALAASGLNLSASIINLIVAILKARSKGVKRGDKHKSPVELIVRGLDKKKKFVEIVILRVDVKDKVDAKNIGKLLKGAIKELFNRK